MLLRDLRKAAGLTQDELAQRAGIGVRTVRDLENGRAVRPQRSTVELLVVALGLDGGTLEQFAAAARARPSVRVQLRPATTLIGRDEAVADISELVRTADLVTLVGISGVGKQSLAIVVGHRVAEHFSAGVGGVSVTEASTEAEVLSSAVSALGAGRLEHLASRLTAADGLLILFGADRNLAATWAALAWLRTRCPRLHILATSRRPLGLAAEHEWPVPPLDVPPPTASDAEVFGYSATKLFLDRLRRVRTRPAQLAEAPVLGALIRRLSGLPLALELAAARGRVLDLDEILARSAEPGTGDHEGDVVITDPVARGLREVVLASWRWLSPPEQACLRWLSVFQWRWSMELAEQMLTGELAQGVGGDVVALVDRLVGLGLVAVRPGPHEIRFWLLDEVRAVALEQAARERVLSAARDRHASLMAAVVAGAPAEYVNAPKAVTDRVESLLSDLYAALDHLTVLAEEDPADDRAARLRVGLRDWLDRGGLRLSDPVKDLDPSL